MYVKQFNNNIFFKINLKLTKIFIVKVIQNR